MADFASTISRQGRTYTVTRPAAPRFSGGRPVLGTPTTFDIVAVIWPASSRDLLRLPEGDRSDAMIAVITATELRTSKAPAGAQGVQSDRLAWRGDVYEVRNVEAWTELGNFFQALAAKVGQ